jgi:hypothetical protein
MKVSIHAGERFLERVMSKQSYTCFDINRAIEYLEILLKDVVPNSRSMYFVLPGFENFKVVYKEGNVVTIIPKGDKYVR